jgi:hypothetical protein
VAYDLSPVLRDVAQRQSPAALKALPEERGPVVVDKGFFGDGALQTAGGFSSDTAVQASGGQSSLVIPAPIENFEGLSNQDNFNVLVQRGLNNMTF